MEVEIARVNQGLVRPDVLQAEKEEEKRQADNKRAMEAHLISILRPHISSSSTGESTYHISHVLAPDAAMRKQAFRLTH